MMKKVRRRPLRLPPGPQGFIKTDHGLNIVQLVKRERIPGLIGAALCGKHGQISAEPLTIEPGGASECNSAIAFGGGQGGVPQPFGSQAGQRVFHIPEGQMYLLLVNEALRFGFCSRLLHCSVVFSAVVNGLLDGTTQHPGEALGGKS